MLPENELGDEHWEEVITPPIVRAPRSIKHQGYVRNEPPLFLVPLFLPLPVSQTSE